jgi:hypothetical protein
MKLPFAGLILACLAAFSLHGSAVSQQANHGAGLQYLRLDDPVYGVPEGNLPFFAGWKGTATVERQDPQCLRCPGVGLHMTSADGSEVIQQMAMPLHTSPINLPAQYRASNAVVTRFSSTGDLLLRYVLPTLRLGGQPGTPVQFGDERAQILHQKLAEKGMGNAHVEIAGVLLSGAKPGKEYFVFGITLCSNFGTQRETTLTTVEIVEAPPGKAEALARAWMKLPVIQLNPAWQRMDDDRSRRDLAQSQATLQGQQQQMSNAAASQKAISDGHIAASNQSNAIARQGAADRAAQNNSDFAKQQQLIRDSGALSTGAQNGNGSGFKYCNANNQSTWVYNSLNPPTAPGGPWHRCD